MAYTYTEQSGDWLGRADAIDERGGFWVLRGCDRGAVVDRELAIHRGLAGHLDVQLVEGLEGSVICL